MMAPSAIDVERIVAFDVHVHLEHTGDQTEADKHAAAYFKGGGARDAASLAEYYRSRNMACVIFTVDETLTGTPRLSNDEVVAFAQQNRDIAIPFASINPTRGGEAVREARRLVDAGAVRGLKLHPPIQEFFPNDRIAYPLYEVFAEAQLPVIFHTGHSGIGTGMRAGGGIRLKYGNPMPIDDVAVDFPDMPIIMAHPSFPWQDEAISICLHKQKVLFGSDYPLLTPDRWLADFEKLPMRDEVRPLILKENAVRLLGLK
jgi:predicted TIM-barrel fold metal-dependent hydrolase